MTIYPVYAQDTPSSQQDNATAYDSIWAHSGMPAQQPAGIERVMLAEDKLFVVLAVVLVIWFGLAFFVFRTDRKILNLERTVQKGIREENLT